MIEMDQISLFLDTSRYSFTDKFLPFMGVPFHNMQKQNQMHDKLDSASSFIALPDQETILE